MSIGHSGYIDRNGKMAIGPKFDDGGTSLKAWPSRRATCFYIDRSGTPVLKTRFDLAMAFL
jgi:hypothetical protein